MNPKELIEALETIAKEKEIDKEVIFTAIEESLTKACKKYYETLNKNSQTRYPGTSYDFIVDINRTNGNISVFTRKLVVESYEAFVEQLEKEREAAKALMAEDENADEAKPKKKEEKKNIDIILYEDAKRIYPTCNIGDFINISVDLVDLNRISAQTAKQVVIQKVKEAERKKLYESFRTKEFEVETGIIQRVDEKNNVIISLGKLDAILPFKETIEGEEYKINDRLKVYVVEVKDGEKGPKVKVSRKHPNLVKRLFEQEVPEVANGDVEIKGIAREAGKRTKIAVYSEKTEIDPVGTCVGENSNRVNVIIQQLNGEKIDIVKWNEDPKEYIAAALNPAKVIAIEINVDENPEDGETIKSAKVVVPDKKLSLAIGNRGQNVRLAAKLTGWKIDIKGEAQAKELNWIDNTLYEAEEVQDDIYDEEI